MNMDEWIIRYIPDDIILAIPSDAEHIAWESFPAILEECPEDEDTVGVYCKGSTHMQKDRWPLAGEHGWEEQNEVSGHTRGAVSVQRMGNGMDILEILKFLK